MAKHRGRGVATINYPIGMNLGGDPSQALVHSNPSGKFTVALSSIDLGQGMKSVTRQICAETLGVPVEDVYVDTADSDTGPHCMGSFASRGTHRVGNAVMAAAREARAVMMEAAAEELEVDPGDLETDGLGSIRVKGAPHRSISVRDVAIAAQFRQGKTISGRGIFLVPLSDVDPETGEMTPATCYAHACLIVEVEVDDETGEVTVLKMTSAYEIGRAINPKLVEQQLVGGSWMGMSHALYETPEPYYPDTRERTAGFWRIPDARPRRHLSRTTSRCSKGRRRTDRSAPRVRARCAPIRCCRRSPMRCLMRSACASTNCRSRRRRSSGRCKARGGAAAARAISSHGGSPYHCRHRQPARARGRASRRLLFGRRRAFDGRLSRARPRQAIVARRRAGRRQDRSGQSDRRRARPRSSALAMLRRHRRGGGAL